MKYSKYLNYYALATQGILTMVILMGLGFYIGYKIDAESAWPGILATIGMLIGLFTFISYLLYLIKQEEKRKNGKKVES